MNNFELFLSFGAVVEIRKNYNDDLYNFVKLILNLGFMNNEITHFINTMGLIKEFKNGSWEKVEVANNLALNDKLQLLDEWFTDEDFWHIIDINEGKQNRICIEYQLGKGFTFDLKQNYIKYDDEIKVFNVEDLIKACNKEDLFNMNYVNTTFKKELQEKDEQLATELDNFNDFYEWELVKYSNGLYNVFDSQTKEMVGYFGNEKTENGTLRDCIERVFHRMVDYFTDENYDIDLLYDEGGYDYVKNTIQKYINLGKQYNLYNDTYLELWLADVKLDYDKILEEDKK